MRVYKPGIELVGYSRYPEEVSLITKGMVDLQTKHGDRFMILPESAVFNDYQLLFNLRTNMIYKAHSPAGTNNEELRESDVELRTMNLDCEKFHQLIDLYPDTAENLKLRALEKRSVFSYYKHKMEQRIKLRTGKALSFDAPSARTAMRNPLLYASTYEGLESDSDELHISKPFRIAGGVQR